MMKRYEDWFAGYTADIRACISGFFQKEGSWLTAHIPAVLDEVDLKIEHTYLVRDHCRALARWLKMPEADVELAALIGLFHDLGRFEQALRFGTMDDRVTGSHGAMSAEVFEQAWGADFAEAGVISAALRYHGDFTLPETLTERQTLFAKIIRDADKLDIFRFSAGYYSGADVRNFRHIMSTSDGPCTPEVLEAVMRGENLRVGSIRCQNDRRLMLASMVFDLNYGYSLEWLLARDYLAVVLGSRLEAAHAFIEDWMRQRLEEF